jgi:hypothetical protein
MANNVEMQLQRAIEMKGKVQEFAANLTRKMNDLEDTLVQSVRAGFPEDIAGTYHEGYFVPDRTIIDDLSKDMLTRHVDFLDRVIDRLTEATDQK